MKTRLLLCAMLVSIASTVVGQQVSVNYNHGRKGIVNLISRILLLSGRKANGVKIK